MGSDHKFREKDTLFDGSTDMRVALVPLVVLDIIVFNESWTLSGKEMSIKIQQKKERRGKPVCLEEEKYFFHIALLGGS